MELLLKRPKFKIGLEMIEFQTDKFGIQIETIITKIKNIVDSNNEISKTAIQKLEEIQELQNLIKHRLNLKTFINTKGHMLAAILPFYSNKNHIFIQEFFRGNFYINDQEKLLSKLDNKRGTVDLKGARLGGIFSEYENQVYIDFKVMFSLGLSPAEITGILLHELGHGFEVCEYSDRTATVNQVLADVAKVISKKKETDLTYIYKEINKIDKNFTEKQLDDLVNGNRIVAGVEWFKLVIKASGQNIRPQLNNGKYDDTSFEMLADNFANRFGYGRSLITGLDKLSVKFGDPAKSSSSYLIHSMFETLLLGITIGAIAFLGLHILTVYATFITLFTLIYSGDGAKDYTYDQLKQRYVRVRNDMVHILKDEDLDKKYIKTIVDDIKVLDTLISETSSSKSMFNVISNFVFNFNRQANNSINEQMLLEELANNELFLKSAELKV